MQQTKQFKIGDSFAPGQTRLANKTINLPRQSPIFKPQFSHTLQKQQTDFYTSDKRFLNTPVQQPNLLSRKRPAPDQKSVYYSANNTFPVPVADLGEESTSKPGLSRTVPRNLIHSFKQIPTARPQPKLDILENYENFSCQISIKIGQQLQHNPLDDLVLTNQEPVRSTPTVEFKPLQEVLLSSLSIPQFLTGQQFTAHLITKRYVLLATQTSLHCWDYDKNTTFSYKVAEVQCMKNLECYNGQAALSKFKCKDSELIILILETGEVRLLNMFIESQKFEENQIFKQSLQSINCCAYFKKNGRFFYGGQEGQVKELVFKDYTDSFYYPFMSNPKQIQKVNHEGESLISQIVPQYFKPARCEIVKMELDDQRNTLYVLKKVSQGSLQGTSVIDVFDLGVLADKLEKVTSITTKDLSIALGKFISVDKKDGDVIVTHLIPIPYAQSQRMHLMLITESQERVQIQFEQKDGGQPTLDDIEKRGLQADLQLSLRFTPNWQVCGYARMPDLESFQNAMLADQIFSNFFGIHEVSGNRCYKQDFQNLSYCPFVGLTFTEGAGFYVAQKNLGYYEQLKQDEGQTLDPQLINIYEGFSLVLLGAEQDNYRMTNGRGFIQPAKFDEIIGVETGIISGCRQEQQWLVGVFQFQDILGRQNLNYQNPSSNILYSQAFIPQITSLILTQCRLMVVSHIRPIDHLYMLLKIGNPQHFDEFQKQYTALEACIMLVQILSDHSGRYQQTSKELKILEQQQQVQQLNQGKNSRSYARTGVQFVRSNLGLTSAQHDELFCCTQPAVELFQINENIKAEAFKMLQLFGDTVVSQHSTSLKHEALLTYLTRILRPIWELNLVAVKNGYLLSNSELFLVVRDKLADLIRLIKFHHNRFVGMQYSPPELQKIEAIEMEQIQYLQIFMNRAFAILEIATMLTDSVLKQIKGDLANQLHQFDFQDMVSTTQHNSWLRALLDELVKVKDSDFQARIEAEQLIVEHLFTKEENATFSGVRCLELALSEGDPQKKRSLIEKGFRALEMDLTIVDLEKVLPLLIKNQNIVAALKLCSLKAGSQNEIKDQSNIEQCYNYALQIVHAVVTNIQRAKPTSDLGKLIHDFIESSDNDKKSQILVKGLQLIRDDQLLTSHLLKFYIGEEQSWVCDAISAQMTQEQIRICCNERINAVSPLPKPQIKEILRILKKNKIIPTLLQVTISVVTNNLEVEPVYSMEDRQKLCADTKLFASSDQSTIDKSLVEEIHLCQRNLTAQLECISRLKEIQQSNASEALKQLNNSLVSIKELQAIYIEFNLNDLRLKDLLSNVTSLGGQDPSNTDQARTLIQKHFQTLGQLQDNQKFQLKTKSFFQTFFQERKYPALCEFAIDQVFKIKLPDLQAVKQGTPDWFIFWLIQNQYKTPSEIILKYSQRIEFKFETLIVLTCIRSWMKLLEDQSVLLDFKQNGIRIQSQLNKIEQFFLNEQAMLLEKSVEDCFKSIIDSCQNEIAHSLQQINVHPIQQPNISASGQKLIQDQFGSQSVQFQGTRSFRATGFNPENVVNLNSQSSQSFGADHNN